MVISAKSIKLKKKMSLFSTTWVGVGQIEYDAETESWIKVTTTFINQKASLTIFNLMMGLKKIIYCYITK